MPRHMSVAVDTMKYRWAYIKSINYKLNISSQFGLWSLVLLPVIMYDMWYLFFSLPYRTLFGGISALTKDHFMKVNGFSNRYWGWGAEDDDMANRIAYHGLYISRYSPSVARYKMLRHKHQKVNFNRWAGICCFEFSYVVRHTAKDCLFLECI
jgi:predicted glycosyltransferase involved in capsule biosynthesis